MTPQQAAAQAQAQAQVAQIAQMLSRVSSESDKQFVRSFMMNPKGMCQILLLFSCSFGN
jgi:hypothetical protein